MKYLFPLILSMANTLMAGFGNDLHRYFWANYNQYSGKPNEAYAQYQTMLSNNESVYTYKGYIHFLAKQGQYQKIVPLIEKTEKNFQDDPDTQLIFAQALMAGKQTEKANAMILKLSNTFKTHMEIVFEAARIYVEQKKLNDALRVIDGLLNNVPRKPNHFIFHFLKAQIYTQQNKAAEAIKSLEVCTALHPHFDKSWLLFAIIQEQQGKLTDAIKGYTNYLQIVPIKDKGIEQHLLSLMIQQKVATEKNQQTLLVNKTCYEKALILFDRHQYKEALEHVNTCIKADPKKKDSQLLKIQILHAMGQDKEVVELLTQAMLTNPNETEPLETMHLLARSGASPTLIIKSLEQIHEKYPKNLKPTLYLADMYTRVGNRSNALAYLEKSASLTDDPELKTKIYHQIGMHYYELKEYDKMVDVLEKGRALKTEFPPLLNLLAYHYAFDESKLDTAQTLIKSVLHVAPTNPHFLDTQALILYKQKEYTKAQELLTRLAQHTPDDPTILIHLAKTEAKLGNTQQATTLMLQAQRAARASSEQEYSTRILKEWNDQ